METAGNLVSPETRRFVAGGAFELECGQTLANVETAYRTWGRLDAGGDNAVIVCHPLTASADVESWWPGLMGPGRALDPSRDFVVCSNVLGGCYGTTGPAHPDPATGRPWGGGFPPITVGDMVRMQRRLAAHLGIRRVALVIGGSLGGMQALEWAARYPGSVDAVAAVATAARQPPWAIAWSEAQRQAIASGGLAAARAVALVGYRHWQGFEQRFARERRADGVYEVASYLRHQGGKFARRFDAGSYLALLAAMDRFDLGAGRGGRAEKVLGGIRMPVLVASIDSDLLYPVEEQVLLARHLPRAEHVVLRSPHGHDGFLIETERLNAFVCEFRARNAAAGRGGAHAA